METIRKKVLVDECNRPVAVQIDYDDWVRIERLLRSTSDDELDAVDLSPFYNVIHLREDPLEYQTRVRGEWNGQST